MKPNASGRWPSHLLIKWEGGNPGQFVHKGTGYYFWGMTTLLRGDLDKGYALMHQAVEEDIRTSGQTVPKTPAYALASLDYKKADQAFRQWVIMQVQFLNDCQNHYSKIYGRQFILDDFRGRFLATPPNIDMVFLFTYTVARLMRPSKVPQYALKSRFASQLELNLLFDISLVIDAAIKAKNPGKWKFIDHAEFITTKAGQPLSNQELRDINAAYDADFNTSLQAMVDGIFTFPNCSALTRLQSDVAVAYGIRNRAAHNVASIPMISDRFKDIQQILFNVVFLIVDYLY